MTSVNNTAVTRTIFVGDTSQGAFFDDLETVKVQVPTKGLTYAIDVNKPYEYIKLYVGSSGAIEGIELSYARTDIEPNTVNPCTQSIQHGLRQSNHYKKIDLAGKRILAISGTQGDVPDGWGKRITQLSFAIYDPNNRHAMNRIEPLYPPQAASKNVTTFRLIAHGSFAGISGCASDSCNSDKGSGLFSLAFNDVADKTA